MAVTPIFSYTPQNATLIAGMLVGYSTASADPDSNSGTWSPWNGSHRGMVSQRLAISVTPVHL